MFWALIFLVFNIIYFSFELYSMDNYKMWRHADKAYKKEQKNNKKADYDSDEEVFFTEDGQRVIASFEKEDEKLEQLSETNEALSCVNCSDQEESKYYISKKLLRFIYTTNNNFISRFMESYNKPIRLKISVCPLTVEQFDKMVSKSNIDTKKSVKYSSSFFNKLLAYTGLSTVSAFIAYKLNIKNYKKDKKDDHLNKVVKPKCELNK